MELKVKPRTITGKKVKKLRREGLIPAEIFGHNVENKHVSVDEKEFKNLWKIAGSHTIIQLLTEDGVRIPALISEVQHHPLTRKPLAVLFQQVRADETIETKVPIEFKGVAPAEKKGLILVKVLNEIEIEALPDKIPHSFEVDLTNLNEEGDAIHINELNVPEGVKVLLPKDTVIVSVTGKEKEEEVAPPLAETTPLEAEAAAPKEEAKAPETETSS